MDCKNQTYFSIAQQWTTLACGFLFLLVIASATNAQTEQTPARPVTSTNFIEVTDETGRSVRVPQPVQRIVSLAPNLTELVFALGAGDRLVADTDYCDYSPEALAKPKVGGAINPSIEQVVAFRPDVVLMTKTLNRRETVLALEQLGIALYATDPRNVQSVLASFRSLGDLIGERDHGRQLEQSLRARLDDLKRRLSTREPRRVLFIVWLEPFITIGRETFIADALRWAGAESVITTSQDWPQISLEEIVHLQPEYLVFASSREESVTENLKTLSTLPGWRSLDAVHNKRIAIVSDAINRPAPRMVEAIEELARQLHPSAFGEKQDPPGPRLPARETPSRNPPHLISRAVSRECFPCPR